MLLPPELNGPQFLADLMVEDMPLEGVTVTVPDGPGLGVTVPEARVRESLLKLG